MRLIIPRIMQNTSFKLLLIILIIGKVNSNCNLYPFDSIGCITKPLNNPCIEIK